MSHEHGSASSDGSEASGSDPRRFGRYELRELLGRGGMGEVWRAHDTHHDREVALKRILGVAAGDAEFRSRFMREARITARLTSPHVIPLHDFGEIDGRPYLDMRLIVGDDLEAVLGAHPGGLPARRAVTIVSQVAEALDAAHDQGMVHRDVKPSNVLLAAYRGADFAYLVDFGVARAADSTGLTGTGTAVGTVAYMAPELFTGDAADARSDVYGLGCLLFEALTGRRAVEGSTAPALIHAHLYGPVPRTGRDDLGAIDEVIARALAKDPVDRHPRAGTLAEAAVAALEVPAVTNRVRTPPGPDGTTVPVRGPACPAPGAPTQVADAERWSGAAAPASSPPPRRRGAVAVALAVLLLAVVVGVVGVVVARSVPGTPPPAGPAPRVERIAARPLPATVNNATGIVLSPDGTRAYVAATGSGGTTTLDNRVQVVDLPDGRVVGSITVGQAPIGLAVSPDGRTLYATVLGPGPAPAPDLVAVVEAATGRVLATAPVGVRPYGTAVSPDGRFLYVADYGSRTRPGTTVSVVDVERRAAVRTVPVGPGPWDVAVAPDGRFAYVSSAGGVQAASAVSVISTSDGTVAATIPVGRSPRGIALSPAGDTLYTADNGTRTNPNGTISVIDTATRTVRTMIQAGRLAPVDIALSPDGTRALVVGDDDNRGFPASVAVVDTASNTIIASTPVARGALNAAFASDGRHAYVTTDTGLWVVDVP